MQDFEFRAKRGYSVIPRFSEGNFQNWLEIFERAAAIYKWTSEDCRVRLPTYIDDFAFSRYCSLGWEKNNYFDLISKLPEIFFGNGDVKSLRNFATQKRLLIKDELKPFIYQEQL